MSHPFFPDFTSSSSFPRQTRLIGLTGLRGAGKTEVARILVEQHGFAATECSGPLMDLASRIGWDGTKKDPADYLFPFAPGAYNGRTLLDELGKGMREVLGEDSLFNVVWARLDPERPNVIGGVRMSNEAARIRAHGGQIWQVARRLSTLGDPYFFEADLKPDLVIDNDGNLDDLAAQVRHHIEGVENDAVVP